MMTERTNHVVISKATMMSSLRMRAVNDIETMFKNSFSNKINDMIIIADPGELKWVKIEKRI